MYLPRIYAYQMYLIRIRVYRTVSQRISLTVGTGLLAALVALVRELSCDRNAFEASFWPLADVSSFGHRLVQLVDDLHSGRPCRQCDTV